MTHQQALDTMAAERYLLDEMNEIESTRSRNTSSTATTVRRKFASVNGFLWKYARFGIRDSKLGIRRTGIRDSGFEVRDSGFGIRDPKAGTRDSDVIEFNKRPVWRRPSILLPWAAAASIALVAGYQSLVVVPGLRQAISPQSLSPVMLREATRGSLPVVTVPPGQRFITLGVDVMTRPGQNVRYDLLDAAGNTILSGRTPLPPSDAPLLLLLPADELVQGRHTLIVRDPDSSGAPFGEYSFDVTN
jgi:hypothetical protein